MLPLRMYRCVTATYRRQGEEGSFMTGRERMFAATRGGGMLRCERSQVLRLIALGIAIVASLAVALGATLSAAHAAPGGTLMQFPLPPADSEPLIITTGSVCNRWFVEGILVSVLKYP